ncbi:MAG: beta-ketoacyl synthase N-terminal-like domain-containing protein [Deltaproteobacteria bacterium]|nr:beta-ketoacyl synthase N-terminal-like domain-containing protein [Deltaproteobacteria bacterium]
MDPIAVVGLGGRFPDARDVAAFWELVRAGRSAVREVPAGRWVIPPARALATEEGAQPDRVTSARACFLEDEHLELEGLALSDELVELLPGLDPMFRIGLAAARDAWLDCRREDLDPQRVDVVLGNIALPTETTSRLAVEVLGGKRRPSVHPLNRFVVGLPAGLIARALGLGGDQLALDAACASSLFAVALACERLWSRRADAVLAGGIGRPDSLYTHMGFSQLRALSPDGRCAPFDRRGNGLVMGEGAGVFVLKRLEDALRAGDRIRGLIRGVGLSNDTDGKLLSPSSEGQLRAMRAAYRQAGWSPSSVELIECHATGTPVGDATELRSLRALWEDAGGDARRCIIGSVKSNVGHLLTGAGAAGMMKALQALEHRTLPPTANFEEGLADLADSPFEVLRRAEPWAAPIGGGARRAAVSGFGFGGTNAHLLLEEWRAEDGPAAGLVAPAPAPRARPAVAIVGLGGRFGPWAGREALTERLLGLATPGEPPAPGPHAWADEGLDRPGHYLEAIEVAFGAFRIPPTELKEMLPQQLLMLVAAAEALAQAGGPGEEGLTTGAYLGIGLDLNTTTYHARWVALEQGAEAAARVGPPLTPDRTMGALGGIVASRIAREFGLGGPCFVLSSEESSALSALELAVRALQRGEIDRALAGAVDLAGDVRVQALPLPGQEPAVVGEGAGAVVLRRLEDALAAGEEVLAVIEGVGSASGGGLLEGSPEPETFLRAARRARADAAGDEALPVDLLELVRGGVPTRARQELIGWLEEGRDREGDALTLVRASERVGESGAASGMAGLLRAVLSLHHRILPADAEGAARPWLRDAQGPPRRAAISAHSVDGKVVHVLLREGERRSPTLEPRPATLARETLLLLSADDRPSLAAALRSLAGELSREPLLEVARRAAARQQAEPGRFGLALVARDGEEGHGLATLALAVLEDPSRSEAALESELMLGSRGRITCTFSPLGGDPEALAFVYPGSGNHFPGMGRWAGLRWPHLLEPAAGEDAAKAGGIKGQLQPRLSWQTELAGMNADPAGLIRAQVALGIALTRLVEGFGLRPRHALGYSLGETAALFSLGAWTDRAEMARRMRETPLFVDQLCGANLAARELLGEREPLEWAMAVVQRDPLSLKLRLVDEERVFLLIVNTPEECVIGGEARAVAAFAGREGLELHPVEGVTTVHCPVVQPVGSAYRDLHLLPTTPPEGVTFYSGARGEPYRVDRESAADAILAQALEGIDFAATVESAHAGGARLFLEIGPGGSCTRMISRTLADRPHAAVALHVAGQDPERTLLRALALLHVHRVPLDLSPLFEGRSAPPVKDERPGMTLKVGLGPIAREKTGTETGTERARTPIVTEIPMATDEPLPRTRTSTRTRTVVPVEPAPPPPVPMASPAPWPAAPMDPMLAALADAAARRAEAHRFFLASSQANLQALGQGFAQLAGSGDVHVHVHEHVHGLSRVEPEQPSPRAPHPLSSEVPRSLDHDQCIQFAVGKIGEVLGARFAHVDAHPTRVRLPEGPLMLVDRIPLIEGEPNSMRPGRVLTEHTVHPGRWYLDAGRIPTGVCVESGQADLFLSGWLGIDSETRGEAVYRLLDAKVTFHRGLPRSGETILHDIRILEFFQQAGSWFFRFEYDSTIEGEPVLTMRDGLAGFFTDAALAAGEGLKASRLDLEQRRPRPAPELPAAAPPIRGEAWDGAALDALERGDLGAAFGGAFASLGLRAPTRLPGGKLRLVDAITEADESGGWYGRGRIVATRAIHPDDWFLTCHFVDDQVMPGTLMYESALQALRVFLMRKGWVGEQGAVVFEPVPGVQSVLKCRGQVVASTREATYEVQVKELAVEPGRPPHALADVIMYADGRPIVEIVDMSLQATGLDRDALVALWGAHPAEPATLYGPEQIRAYAEGRPSEGFGEPYRIFDEERRIARLPRDPYLFMDRVTRVKGAPFVFEKGAEVDAEVAVDPAAWYFRDGRQPTLPFAVLLEIALQPCGWLAAYVGSALQSATDLHFRNLGGEARHHRLVTAETGLLYTRTRLTDLSKSGDTIIQHFAFEVLDAQGPVYTGTTYFGFFTGAALANQVGLRGKSLHDLSALPAAASSALDGPGLPVGMLRMMDAVDHLSREGGPHGHGGVQGSKTIDPAEWFFQAHFYQDPVWPGSLGIEAFLQLLMAAGAERWGARRFTPVLGADHRWSYRGQVIPADQKVIVQTVPTAIDDTTRTMKADGFLAVDGRLIYEMKDFALRCDPEETP